MDCCEDPNVPGWVRSVPVAPFAVDGIEYWVQHPGMTIRPMIEIVNDFCSGVCDDGESACLWDSE
jgi:hypothetical protein